MDNISCIFVADNGREIRRELMPHPGMESFVHEWVSATPVPDSDKFTQSKVRGRFYWDHMDARGNHVFRQCAGFEGEKI